MSEVKISLAVKGLNPYMAKQGFNPNKISLTFVRKRPSFAVVMYRLTLSQPGCISYGRQYYSNIINNFQQEISNYDATRARIESECITPRPSVSSFCMAGNGERKVGD